MGNRLTVERPYIIDDYPSDDDDDDDDDDYFNYETAYDTEGADPNQDEEDRGSRRPDMACGDKGGAGCGQEVSVDSQVVSSLVKEVETLLSYLDKEDYEGAQKAARLLKDVGGDGGEESKPLLAKSDHSIVNGQNTTDKMSMDKIGEEGVPLLSPDALISGEEWTTAQRRALQKLDRDLTSFEENESRVVTDSGEETNAESRPRRKRKSSLPRLKRNAFLSSHNTDVGSGSKAAVSVVSSSGSGSSSSSGGGGIRNRSRSRESSLNRSSASPRVPRSPGSCIPRFCHTAYTAKYASSLAHTTATGDSQSQSVADRGRSRKGVGASTSLGGSGSGREAREPVDEAITSCVQGFTSQAIPDCTNSRDVPVHYESEKDRSVDVMEAMGNEPEMLAWEINLSEMTGRVKQNKKRSAIPSLWTCNKADPVTSSIGTHPSSPSSSTDVSSTSHTTDSLNLSPSQNSVKTVIVNSATQTPQAFDEDGGGPCWPTGFVNVTPPVSVDTARWDFSSRKVFDQRRCLHPLSQEDAMTILGYEAPFDNIKFGPTTGNIKLMRWFQKLNNHFKVSGKCFFLYKPCGRNRTCGVTSEVALEKLKSGLQDKHKTFIYHCHNHYFCPVGFEESPLYPVEAYNEKLSEESSESSWILIGETSRNHGPVHCKSWEDICLDLNCESPYYYDIRKTWQGMQKRNKVKRMGGNLHCILCFQSSTDNQNHHNKSGLSPIPSFRLHPPPASYSYPSSSQDGDGGSNDCGGNILEDFAVTLTPNEDQNEGENDGENDYDCWKTFEDGIVAIDDLEEEEEIESVSSLDLDEEDNNNYDADSLS